LPGGNGIGSTRTAGGALSVEGGGVWAEAEIASTLESKPASAMAPIRRDVVCIVMVDLLLFFGDRTGTR
jgi:hypothetical protein